MLCEGCSSGGVSLAKYAKHGPGPTDVEVMMRALEQINRGQVQLVLTPAGISATGGLSTVLSFLRPSVAGGPTPEEVLVIHRWPCEQHSDFWSCIYEGLWQLDHRIAQVIPDTPHVGEH